MSLPARGLIHTVVISADCVWLSMVVITLLLFPSSFEVFLNGVFALDLSHFPRSQWGMKISRWCSSSTSSRWWYQSASLSRDQCRSTTVLSHPHSRIAQGRHVWLYADGIFIQMSWQHSSHSGRTWSLSVSAFCPHSPSVGYLQPPSSEQYQITQSPSPCNPQQLQQQYSGMTWWRLNLAIIRRWIKYT